jgi:hypothetical protein
MRLVVASASVDRAAPGGCDRCHSLGASVAYWRADAMFPRRGTCFSGASGNDATAKVFSYRFL